MPRKQHCKVTGGVSGGMKVVVRTLSKPSQAPPSALWFPLWDAILAFTSAHLCVFIATCHGVAQGRAFPGWARGSPRPWTSRTVSWRPSSLPFWQRKCKHFTSRCYERGGETVQLVFSVEEETLPLLGTWAVKVFLPVGVIISSLKSTRFLF